jgi:hypothetical protein
LYSEKTGYMLYHMTIWMTMLLLICMTNGLMYNILNNFLIPTNVTYEQPFMVILVLRTQSAELLMKLKNCSKDFTNWHKMSQAIS